MPKPDAARPDTEASTVTDVGGFALGDAVMHPAHGVGRVTGDSTATVGGETLELVHFAFGLLMVYPLWRFIEQHARLSSLWAATGAMCVVMAASAGYEIVEWMMAVLFAPDWAEAYNGQQGDLWDAQKDMALATAGGLISIGLIAVARRTKRS